MSEATIKMPRRFDYSASAAFKDQIAQRLSEFDGASRKIILDCSQLEYIDSAGIGILVMSHKKTENSNAQLAMVNIKPTVKEILYLANMQKLIEIN